MVEYLGCCLDAKLSGESMAMKSHIWLWRYHWKKVT